MRSVLAADLDREQSLGAMRHAFRASKIARRTYVEMDAGVVQALLQKRYYDPSHGQFLTEDPVFWGGRQNLNNPQGLNAYSYANDNPITGKDPDGLASSNSGQIIGLIQQAIAAIQQMISILSVGGGGTTYIGDIYVRFTDKSRNIFSDLIVSRNVDGKNLILYRVTKDGFFRFGEQEFGFDEKEFGGFLGYVTPLIGNDFFVVEYLGADKTKSSDPLIVYWDSDSKQFRVTLNESKDCFGYPKS